MIRTSYKQIRTFINTDNLILNKIYSISPLSKIKYISTKNHMCSTQYVFRIISAQSDCKSATIINNFKFRNKFDAIKVYRKYILQYFDQETAKYKNKLFKNIPLLPKDKHYLDNLFQKIDDLKRFRKIV